MGKKREITDIYDRNCKRTGKTIMRGEKPRAGEYLMAATAIVRVKESYLVTKRSPMKSMAGLWEFPGGGSRTGEEPMDTLFRELREETGIVAQTGQTTFLRQVYYEKFQLFMQVFLVEADARREELKLQEEEVSDAMFVTPGELEQLYSYMTELDRQIYREAVSPMFSCQNSPEDATSHLGERIYL
ncbi:MAG: NUDIX domain-containing protein [Roseburia sp.]|nr:NUDIX domain-containing protein [Roseburia sp.]